MASGIFDELRRIQALLAGPSGTAPLPLDPLAMPPLHAPPPASTTSESEGDSPALPPPRPRTAPLAAAPTPRDEELQRLVASLREQQAEGEGQVRRLEEALRAAQLDGRLVAEGLRTQLQAKHDEAVQLAEVVFALRDEADNLRLQLASSSQLAEDSGRSTRSSIVQLQEAAAEWRRQGEQSMLLLEEERAHSRALLLQVEELRARVLEERQHRKVAEAELADLRAAGSSPVSGGCGRGGAHDLLMELRQLRQRLQAERGWRHACQKWLSGELRTRSDLERLLVSVAAAVRLGPAEGDQGGDSWVRRASTVPAPVPFLPPRQMAASQLAVRPGARPVSASPAGGAGPTAAKAPMDGSREGSPAGLPAGPPAAGATVAGSASATAVAAGTSRDSGQADWRRQFEAVRQAFDERHTKLLQELSALQHEALDPAP